MEILATLTRLFERRKVTAVFPLDGNLIAMTVVEGKELARFVVPLSENPAESFRALREKGMKSRRLTLLVNESLQWEKRRFPAMTEEEFKETMYWEEDRLFSGEEPLVMGYRVLSEGTDGYDILFTGIPKEELTAWETAAQEAGLTIGAALPVTDISISQGPYLALYVSERSGVLFFVAKEQAELRHLTLRDAGKAARFLEHITDQREEPLPLFLLPFSEATEEDMAAWKDYVTEEIGALPLGEGKVELVELSETPLDSGASLLALSLAQAGTHFPLTMAGAFLSKGNRGLRIAQGVCALGLVYFLFACGDFFWQTHQMNLAVERNRALAPVKEQLAAEQQRTREEAELLEMVKDLEKKSPHWEAKLLALADSMPRGVVLKSIKNQGGNVRIEGTATSGGALQDFANRLPQQWGGKARLKGRKQNQDTGLLEFTVEWKEGEK